MSRLFTDRFKKTKVFDAYWHFAAERQRIFFARLDGCPPPWTDDSILQHYKFTNAYRASDRTSQYLIRNVIYGGAQDFINCFFRTILFKLFNRIETWEYLTRRFGEIYLDRFDLDAFDAALTEAISSGERIYSAAYIMPSASGAFGFARKHSNHLRLIEAMIRQSLPEQIASCGKMEEAYNRILNYPSIGPFLAYQLVSDLNYSKFTDFSESEFVQAGPGAVDGIRKSFEQTEDYSPEDIIRATFDEQEAHFKRRGLFFPSLWGRRLQLIDCQNLFCEISKYSRVAFPNIQGATGRTKIKQKFENQGRKPVPTPWYPPKWGLNQLIKKDQVCLSGQLN